MGRRANPYPGWWASPDLDSDDEPIEKECWKDVPPKEPLPKHYRGKPFWQTRKESENWSRYDSSNDNFKSHFWDEFFGFKSKMPKNDTGGVAGSFAYEDPYSILGMKKSDSNDDLKKGYYKKAKIHHPDRGGTKELFQKLADAWDQIKFWRGLS